MCFSVFILYMWVMFRGVVVMGRVRGWVMLLFRTGTLPPPNIRFPTSNTGGPSQPPELNFKDGCHMCDHYRYSSNIPFVSVSGYFLLFGLYVWKCCCIGVIIIYHVAC